MTAHTHEQWRADYSHPSPSICYINHASSDTSALGDIATVWCADPDGDERNREQASRARLIAAAPDLLEALVLLASEEYWKDDDPLRAIAIGKARVAVEKATGEQI